MTNLEMIIVVGIAYFGLKVLDDVIKFKTILDDMSNKEYILLNLVRVFLIGTPILYWGLIGTN